MQKHKKTILVTNRLLNTLQSRTRNMSKVVKSNYVYVSF